jgi:hypothetical protein
MSEPVVTEPGVYTLSNEQYHSGDVANLPSVSATYLKKMIDGGPAKFWANWPGNPNAVEKEPSKALNMGTAAHLILLEEHEVAKRIAVIPLDMLASNGAASTKAAKEFIAARQMAGQTVLKPSEWKIIEDMRRAVGQHPYARRALAKGRFEQSIFWKTHDNFYLKTRPDFMPMHDGQYIVDYKTCAALEKWDRQAVLDLRYDIQSVTQMAGVYVASGVQPKGVLYIVQEKDPPYEVAMRALSIDDITTRAILDNAKIEVQRACDLISACLDTGQWPSKWSEPGEIRAPFWHQRDIETKLEDLTYEFENPYLF